MADKKMIKTPFGELPVENDTVLMSNSQLMEQYEKRGIANAKETLNAINAAKGEIVTAMAEFCSDQTLKSGEAWGFKAGLKENRFEVSCKPEHVVTIPGRNGEASSQQVRYGAVQLKNYSKVPDAVLESEKLRKNAEEMEKKFKKPQIKVA